ncbi:MAG: FAD-dependent oxidoreductase [Alphaproteobacteria bacterium]|nr:FAD-dependent oxidoreductase [Alphaproteobacteria bacterium]
MSAERENDLPPWVAGVETRMHELDPELTDAQIDIVRGYGEETEFNDGDMLWSAGQRDAGLYVVLEGQVEIVDKRGEAEQVIITHGRGHYGGEIATMAGRAALVGGRARGPTRAIAISTARLKDLIALESELGEIVLTSFIVRRMRMIAENHGEVVLYGVAEEAGTAKIRTFLTRQGVPHQMVETLKAIDLPNHLKCEDPDLPVLMIGGETLCNPTIRQVAETLGISAEIESGKSYDVAVIGGGPAGLAAAVYGASEGLSVIVIEMLVTGGQAGTSSRIENYLGFPTGISGQGLAGRAFLQATKFGAEIAVAREVRKLDCRDGHIIHLDGGDTVRAGAIVLASGAVYRQPPIENLEVFTGGGVHYGASYLEAQLCRQKDVAVVGGGNSAGQAAIFLSGFARHVKILIRGGGLESSMSSYLIDRINRTDNIEVVPHTTVQRANGDTKLKSLSLKNSVDGRSEEINIAHLFVFIGAVPATDFLPDSVKLDDRGFVLTGDNLDAETLKTIGWKGDRPPFHLETTRPGIFAVGDVRSGSVKRVASAVGEGSVCIQYVHQILAHAD